ncbi:hypothetical protein [Lactococcus garvieae]|uniref:hypothetical protein n=1 Tax=Lactococcus garvieae TaxID=1363 RepID=UPI002FE45026
MSDFFTPKSVKLFIAVRSSQAKRFLAGCANKYFIALPSYFSVVVLVVVDEATVVVVVVGTVVVVVILTL